MDRIRNLDFFFDFRRACFTKMDMQVVKVPCKNELHIFPILTGNAVITGESTSCFDFSS